MEYLRTRVREGGAPHSMIIPKEFYYEWNHPEIGGKVYFTVDALNRHQSNKVKTHIQGTTDLASWAYLTGIYVHSSLRRQGYGSVLLEEVKDWQDTVGVNLMFFVGPYYHADDKKSDLHTAQLKAMYTKYGFIPIKGLPTYHYRRCYE